MTNTRTPSNTARSSLEAYAAPSELRGAHNFASSAQPIVHLDLAVKPPPLHPLSQGTQPENEPAVLKLATFPPPVPIPETDFSIESRIDDTEPPFRPPASWQETRLTLRPERHWNWSERSTAAFLGFAAGILIIVPLVLFLSTATDQLPPSATAPADPTLPVVQPDAPVSMTQAATAQENAIITASVAGGTWFDSRTTTQAAPSNTSDHAALERQTEADARRALRQGRIAETRTALRAAASPDTPRLWFVLAESYDPLMAHNISSPASATRPAGKLVAADIEFARFYYQQALTYGVSEARARLDALPKP